MKVSRKGLVKKCIQATLEANEGRTRRNTVDKAVTIWGYSLSCSEAGHPRAIIEYAFHFNIYITLRSIETL